VQNKGDQQEYRSCIFTCDSDGCNTSSTIKQSMFLVVILAAFAALASNF
jgi:hypothetical protein